MKLLKYSTSTYIIKAQYPGITHEMLMEYIMKELEWKDASDIVKSGNKVSFTQSYFNSSLIAVHRPLIMFRKGNLTFYDYPDRYVIGFTAYPKKVFFYAIAGFTILMLITNGLWAAIIILITFTFFFMFIWFISITTFSVFFKRLRNKAERELGSIMIE